MAATEYAFHTADAFTEHRYHGAQIAVVPDATGLDAGQMQRVAAEFNLSETVFVFPDESDPLRKRVRIFSPTRELDFAGHPVIAAGHVLASIGQIPLEGTHTRAVFEKNKGPVEVYITQHDGQPILVQFQLAVRPYADRFVPPPSEIAKILDLRQDAIGTPLYPPMLVASDRPYLVVPLRDYDAVRSAVFSYRYWTMSSAPSMMAQEMLLISTQTADPSADFHGRLVGPEVGINEDPPIGAAMPAFAGYLAAQEHVREGTYAFAAERGTPRTRLSILNVEMDNKGREELELRVGGPAVSVSRGHFIAPEA